MTNIFTWSDFIDTPKEILGFGPDLVIKHDALKYFNGWKKDLGDLSIPESWVHFYVWNISSDKESFYNKQFIKNAISTISSKIPDDTDIHIHMGWKVWKLLNPKDPFDTIDAQIDLMNWWIRSLPSMVQKRVFIHDIQDKHQGLMTHVEKHDIQWLWQEISESSWSLYIASLLYKAIESDKKLADSIQGTKPSQVKESGWGDHYATLELAIRIQDMLDGNTLQWWEFRQKRYDAIINNIFRWYKTWGRNKKSIPELERIREMLQEKNISFSQLYFDKNAYEKVKGEQRLLNFARTFILATLVGWASWIWNIRYNAAMENHRVQAQIDQVLEYNFRDKDPKRYTPQHGYVYEREGTIAEEVRYIWQSIVDKFIARYGSGDLDRDDILFMIFDEFDNSYIPEVRPLDIKSYEIFIDENFIPNNASYLTLKGIDIERDQHRDAFLKTYLSTHSWDVLEDDQDNIKNVQSYTTSDSIRSYEIGFLWPENIVVAKHRWHENFSFDIGRVVAKDYLNNYIVKEYVNDIRSIMSNLYGVHSNIDILWKVFEAQYHGDLDMENMQQSQMLDRISFIENYLLDSWSDFASFEKTIERSIDMDALTFWETNTYASYIWAIDIENDDKHIYSVRIDGQSYVIVLDFSIWKHYPVVSMSSFRESKPNLQKILKLL